MSNQININIDEPRYDQNTYEGRAKHFFAVTNPLNLFVTSKTLEDVRSIVTKYRKKEPLPSNITENDLWKAKILYDSAFHPDTGEKMNIIGRMSSQVPMNIIITGGMMTFYQTTPAVLFWQWINQSFNALVNYTNRSGDAKFTTTQLVTSYLTATTGAVATAVGLNKMVSNLPPLIGKWVPFVAVAAANCINIPMMRMQEIQNGTPVFDENNNRLGVSRNAAKSGIAQVVFSRIIMCMPGMILTPILITKLEKKGVMARYPWANLPIQMGVVGLCLTFATPLACACFRQKARINFEKLEPELQEEIRKNCGDEVPEYLVYNKGL